MSDILRTIGEVGFGLLFLVGAIFNLVYTLRHGQEFYGSFAESAWFPPSSFLIRRLVIPRASLITALLVALQISIAILILSRGDSVRTGLIMGCLFCLAAALVSSIGGAIANLILATLMALLAFTQ
ncbi:MAG: hypothetical protein JSW55_07855 [Chloroflexota bacterium]|nr:MAG: hypothetical protein JSW55_07855 [Chloroflexota bacterium]